MSVELIYKENGRIGNHLFQYVFARLLAEKNDFRLVTPWGYPQLLQATEQKNGRVFKKPVIHISDNPKEEGYFKNYTLNRIFDTPLKKGKYILSGYFEDSRLYDKNEALIKSFFVLDPFEKNTEDIVINLRLGTDFHNMKAIIHPQWYLDILNKEKFNKLYIVGSRPDEPYLAHFEKYDPIIVPTDPMKDFHFIRKFDKIVCANSTYSWWAAFLSEADTIYIPDKWLSPFLTSCKNATVVKVKLWEAYEPETNYEWLFPKQHTPKPTLSKRALEMLKRVVKRIIGCS